MKTFASIFSGCGGFDIGYISKGFRSIGAYDNDQYACENFSKNIHSSIILLASSIQVYEFCKNE